MSILRVASHDNHMRPAAPRMADVADTLARDLALVLARVLAGGSLIYFHAWGEVMAGAQHFFGSKAEWDFPRLVSSTGLPYGKAVAVFAVLVAFAAAWALIIGLLSRLAALVLLVISGCVFAAARTDLLRELSVAYSAAFIVLFLAGPGRLAVDSLFTRRRSEAYGRR